MLACVCRHRGFGFPVTNLELQSFNEWRVKNGKSEITASPGVRFLLYGNTDDKEGWWDWDKFEIQLIDMLDLFDFLYPQYQLLVEIDWSAGHSKHRDGALNALAMNVGYGGSQPMMRDTKIERELGFLGDHQHFVKVGDVQRMVFVDTDPPPHFEPSAPKYDQPATETRKAMEGYVGKPKGLRQVLWERGLYHEKMVKEIKKDDNKGRDSTFSMVSVSGRMLWSELNE